MADDGDMAVEQELTAVVHHMTCTAIDGTDRYLIISGDGAHDRRATIENEVSGCSKVY